MSHSASPFQLRLMFKPTLAVPRADPKPKYDYKVIRPNGPWVSSRDTDVSKTWARVRERLKKQAEAASRPES